jgi:hypothetical protein
MNRTVSDSDTVRLKQPCGQSGPIRKSSLFMPVGNISEKQEMTARAQKCDVCPKIEQMLGM